MVRSGLRFLAWRLSRLEPVAPARPDEQKVWLWVWLEAQFPADEVLAGHSP